MNYFSKNLKLLQERSGLKKGKLATNMGIKPTTFSNYLGGHSAPDYDTILEISKYLDVSIDYLLGVDLAEVGNDVDTRFKIAPIIAPIDAPNTKKTTVSDGGLAAENEKLQLLIKGLKTENQLLEDRITDLKQHSANQAELTALYKKMAQQDG